MILPASKAFIIKNLPRIIMFTGNGASTHHQSGRSRIGLKGYVAPLSRIKGATSKEEDPVCVAVMQTPLFLARANVKAPRSMFQLKYMLFARSELLLTVSDSIGTNAKGTDALQTTVQSDV